MPHSIKDVEWGGTGGKNINIGVLLSGSYSNRFVNTQSLAAQEQALNHSLNRVRAREELNFIG